MSLGEHALFHTRPRRWPLGTSPRAALAFERGRFEALRRARGEHPAPFRRAALWLDVAAVVVALAPFAGVEDAEAHRTVQRARWAIDDILEARRGRRGAEHGDVVDMGKEAPAGNGARSGAQADVDQHGARAGARADAPEARGAQAEGGQAVANGREVVEEGLLPGGGLEVGSLGGRAAAVYGRGQDRTLSAACRVRVRRGSEVAVQGSGAFQRSATPGREDGQPLSFPAFSSGDGDGSPTGCGSKASRPTVPAAEDAGQAYDLTEADSKRRYWLNMIGDPRCFPVIPPLAQECGECPANDMYAELSESLSEQPPEIQEAILARWFCHNAPMRGCAGVRVYLARRAFQRSAAAQLRKGVV